ncbi:MAG TPA: hypothetical protein VMV10_17215, partial [Pirellulales bacterium]|nr:hypothetical protein [Pirellulales bacterium]
FEFLRAAVQPFAVRAFVFLLGLHHDGKTLINRRKTTKISSKPVNAYREANGQRNEARYRCLGNK